MTEAPIDARCQCNVLGGDYDTLRWQGKLCKACLERQVTLFEGCEPTPLEPDE